jgi:hypothetical protein
MVVPFADNPQAIFVGLRQVPSVRVALLHVSGAKDSWAQVLSDLQKFKVAHEARELASGSLDQMLSVFSDLKSRYPKHEMVVNLGCADKALATSALCAAFINGLECFDVENDRVEQMPVLKFEYLKLLNGKKLALMHKIASKEEYPSLEALAAEAGMSLPLISYYVRGMKKSQGLLQMGLVSVSNSGSRLKVWATPLGRLMVKDYVPPITDKKHPLK